MLYNFSRITLSSFARVLSYKYLNCGDLSPAVFNLARHLPRSQLYCVFGTCIRVELRGSVFRTFLHFLLCTIRFNVLGSAVIVIKHIYLNETNIYFYGTIKQYQ